MSPFCTPYPRILGMPTHHLFLLRLLSFVTGTVSVNLPSSGGGNGGLPVGLATLWLCVISSNFNLDSFAMEAVPMTTPPPTSGAFGGLPAIIPGLIQVENFDVGGEGVAYSDADPGNNGGVRSVAFFSLCFILNIPAPLPRAR